MSLPPLPTGCWPARRRSACRCPTRPARSRCCGSCPRQRHPPSRWRSSRRSASPTPPPPCRCSRPSPPSRSRHPARRCRRRPSGCRCRRRPHRLVRQPVARQHVVARSALHVLDVADRVLGHATDRHDGVRRTGQRHRHRRRLVAVVGPVRAPAPPSSTSLPPPPRRTSLPPADSCWPARRRPACRCPIRPARSRCCGSCPRRRRPPSRWRSSHRSASPTPPPPCRCSRPSPAPAPPSSTSLPPPPRRTVVARVADQRVSKRVARAVDVAAARQRQVLDVVRQAIAHRAPHRIGALAVRLDHNIAGDRSRHTRRCPRGLPSCRPRRCPRACPPQRCQRWCRTAAARRR